MKKLTFTQIQFIQDKLLKPVVKPCNDCGKMCENRVVTYEKRLKPEPHWIEKCSGCFCYKDPNTGEFTVLPQQYKKVWRDYW